MILSTLKEIYEPILIKEIIGPIAVIIISFFLYSIIKKMIKKFFKSYINRLDERKNKTLLNLIINVIKYFIIFMDIMIILEIFNISTGGFFASLGVIGVVVGLALQDMLKDILSGISIIIENQYAIGDTVTIGDFKGEIISLGIRTTKMRAYTGEIKIISNRNISEVVNHSLSKSLAIIDVEVDYNENLNKVEKVLNELMLKLDKEIPNLKGKIKVLGITNLGESGINYRITVETVAMKHHDVERIIRKEIKQEFDRQKIIIPYKQMVIHNA